MARLSEYATFSRWLTSAPLSAAAFALRLSGEITRVSFTSKGAAQLRESARYFHPVTSHRKIVRDHSHPAKASLPGRQRDDLLHLLAVNGEADLPWRLVKQNASPNLETTSGKRLGGLLRSRR